MTIGAAEVDNLLGGLPSERSYCADLAVEVLQILLAHVPQKIWMAPPVRLPSFWPV